jgi:3-oxoacyl-[acyl-carrier-protein] synthase-3
MGAAVAGWGTAIPDQRVTNADLEARLDTNDAWIVERTGIRERRVAGPEDSTATLASAAGAAAIKDAGLTPGDIDLLIVATVTPEQPLPATAAFVQDALGLSCGAFDLGAACAGFAYALVVGSSLISSGGVGTVLVIGAETLTRIVDPEDRSTAVLFGDGAGAAVLRGVESTGMAPPGVLAWDLGCDGSLARLLEVPAGGSRLPTSEATVAAGQHWLRMEGREVFRRAVRAVVDSALTSLGRAGVTAADVDLFVPHQANARIVDAALTRLGIPPERTVMNIARYGNTSAASIPIALAEAVEDGRLREGHLVLLSGFGAGMTWASVVLRWGRGA